MPNAIIQIEIFGAIPMIAQIQANINGYLSWQAPTGLGLGLQIIKATAIDPLDVLRKESTTLGFNVREIESEKNKQEKEKSKKETTEQGTGETSSSIPPT